MMPKDRTSRVLEEFAAVTRAAPRPASPAERAGVRGRMPVGTLSAASLIVVVVAVAALVFGRSGPAPVAGSSAQPSAPASAPVTSPTAPPSADACDLTARIVSWEGAAGQRIATVEMTNAGTTDCLVELLPRPQLVDGAGNVLVEGPVPAPRDVLQFAAGAHATTLVEVGNGCKPEPQAPISVAFLFGGGQRLIAAPVSPTDVTLPPCNGPSQPATISMHAWGSQ